MMNPTGIKRRIDDIGRIAIPKEIRKKLGLQECEPMEIFIDKQDESILLKKYSTLNKIN